MTDDTDKVLIRRLDWRFLLETPVLGRTVYAGSRETKLEKALARFCSELVTDPDRVNDAAAEGVPGGCDLAVVSGLDVASVRSVLPRLREGGFVYWEIGTAGAWSLHRHPQRYARALRQLELADVRVYWFRPDFADCREIIPLDDRVALLHAFDKVHENVVGRLKMLFGKAMLLTRALPYIVPCFALVARKAGNGFGGAP